MIVNLLEVNEGTYIIKKVQGCKVVKNKLRDMGVFENRIINKIDDHNNIIRVGDATYAIGRGQAIKIIVEQYEENKVK